MKMRLLRKNTEIGMIVLLFLFSILYMFISPVTSSPDEIAHLAYPRHILLESSLPSFTSGQDSWESHQPPLYYLVSLPFVYFAKHLPIETQFTIHRCVSLVFLLLGLFAFLLFLKKTFPSDLSARLVALSVIGIPMSLYISGSFTNDVTLFPIASFLMLATCFRKKSLSPKTAILLGIIFGISLLSKVHLYPLLLVIFLFLLWKQPVRIWVISCACAVCVSGWWFLHNLLAVGDIFGLTYTFILWTGQHENIWTTAQLAKLAQNLLAGFIGVFGKFTIALPIYVYAGISLFFLPLIGKGIYHYRKEIQTRLFLFASISTIALVIYQNTKFFQPQGRYLLGLLPLFGYFAALAFMSFPSKKFRVVVFATTLSLIILLNLLSLKTIHAYYQKNPTHFGEPKTINLITPLWNGDKERVVNMGDTLWIKLPATIYTLRDMRLSTTLHPAVTITLADGTSVNMRIYWKVLGQHAFSDNRMISALVTDTAELRIPEENPDLIQDIQLVFERTENSLQEIAIRYLDIHAR